MQRLQPGAEIVVHVDGVLHDDDAVAVRVLLDGFDPGVGQWPSPGDGGSRAGRGAGTGNSRSVGPFGETAPRPAGQFQEMRRLGDPDQGHAGLGQVLAPPSGRRNRSRRAGRPSSSGAWTKDGSVFMPGPSRLCSCLARLFRMASPYSRPRSKALALLLLGRWPARSPARPRAGRLRSTSVARRRQRNPSMTMLAIILLPSSSAKRVAGMW